MDSSSQLNRFISVVRSKLARVDPGYVAVAAICLLAIWPFLSRSALPQATDTELHIFRLAELSRLVRGGELFPRWAPNFYFGYGYPIFNFYAPLTYHLGLIVDFMPLLGPVQAVKVLFVIGIALSGFGMYGLVRDIWGRGAGLVASASFVYAPFLLFVDPYARGDLPESFSFGVFAMALWAMNRLRQSPSWLNWSAAVLLVAGLILTHNLMSMVFFAILVAWMVWQLVIGGFGQVVDSVVGAARRLVSLRILLALILGLALAAFFWLTVALESGTVNLSSLIGDGGHFDFRNNFLQLGELFGGTKTIDWGASEPDYSLNLGIVQLALGIVGGFALLSTRTKARKQGLFFLLSLVVLIFLMIRQSSPLWEIMPFLPFLQFPWRLLGPAAAMLAVLGGIGASLILQNVPNRFSGWVAAVFVSIILLAAIPLVQVPPWPEDFGPTTAQRVLEYERTGLWLGTTSTADFVPATVDVLPKPQPVMIEGFYSGEPLDRVNRAALPENTVVRSESITPLRTRYHVSSGQDFPLRLFQFDFPGWEAKVDGDRVATQLGRPEGFLVVPVPAGEHIVEVNFGSTAERNVSLIISAAALIATIVIAWQFARFRDRKLVNHPGEVGEGRIDRISVWPVFGISMVMLLVNAAIVEPSGVFRYESADLNAYPAQNSTLANFGDQIALIGYDFESESYSPGDQVDLTLYWKALRSQDINYQVFVHLLDETGSLVAQSDKLNPGDFPTRRWPLDKYVRDTHSLEVPEEAAAGEYLISVGLWVAADGWRLPVRDEFGEQSGDNFSLPELLTIVR